MQDKSRFGAGFKGVFKTLEHAKMALVYLGNKLTGTVFRYPFRILSPPNSIVHVVAVLALAEI